MNEIIRVVIPAFNEENGVGEVLKEIPDELIEEVVVVNNASTDQTEMIAMEAGATVLNEPKKGYGRACLKGINYLNNLKTRTDIIVFLDADHSDYPREMSKVVAPIVHNGYDMVIGSRALGDRQKGSMTPQQILGNWLATTLIRVLYGVRYTDLGPFRAIRYHKLLDLQMKDKNYGWTVEMQLKAAKLGFKTTEVPVRYRKRIGFSKVSGTVKGTIMAGYKIILTIFRYL